MGGRGANFNPPSPGKWSGGPMGPEGREAPTLKEALGKKGKPFSLGDSVVETNPNHSYDYKEFSQNCQRCVVAYELRRRGYDVTALPTYQGDKLPQIAYVDTQNNIYAARWRGAFQGAKTVDVSAKGNNPAAEQKVMDNIAAKMREYGNGARAVVQILYRGGGGHVFNVENQNGYISYVEAQVGKIKDMAKTMGHVRTDAVNLVRVDNLKVSERAKQFVRTSYRHR